MTNNYLKALKLIQAVESQYKSVLNAPSTDIHLRRATKLLGGKIGDVREDKIKYFLRLGFPLNEIVQLTNADADVVEKVAKTKRIAIQDRYRYVSEDGIHATSFEDLRKFTTQPVQSEFLIFSALPVGCKYVAKNSLYRKTTPDGTDYRRTRVAYERKTKV